MRARIARRQRRVSAGRVTSARSPSTTQREARRHKQLADEHGEKAEEHAQEADKAEGGKRRAGQAAGRHDERAAELEDKL